MSEELDEKEATKEEKVEKKGRKMYKGEVKALKDLTLSGPTPVQPVKRTVNFAGYERKLPPTFVITRFQPGYHHNSRLIQYYNPANKRVETQDLPPEIELNVLSGERGTELSAEVAELAEKSPEMIYRRLACTVGTDPEIFVVGKKGEIIPAWTFLGSKEKPDKHWHSCNLYWDGFQAEFTTLSGIQCLIEMCNAIRSGLTAIHNKARAKDKSARLTLSSVLPVDPEVLASAKDEYVAFGCAPSYNVYGIRGNTQEGRSVPYRFTGGHMHFGLDDAQKAKIPEFVRALDTVVGLSCVSLFAKYDSRIRRQFYGQAGEYRTPPHGMEYRVLSNAWLSHPIIMHMVFDLARSVMGLVDHGVQMKNFWAAKEEDTLSAIMNCDVELARKIMSENKSAFYKLLALAGPYNQTDLKDRAWGIWTSGLESLVNDPEDFERNWAFGKDTAWNSAPRYFQGLYGRNGKI